MALMRSIYSSEADEDDVFTYYKKNIIAAKLILKLFRTRLYLVKAAKNPNQNAVLTDITKLEFGLSEAIRGLQKEVIRKRMIHVILERGIQSSVLSASNTNFLVSASLNGVEKLVAKELVLMMDQSKKVQELVEEDKKQFPNMLKERREIVALESMVGEKLALKEPKTQNKDELKAIQKKIDQINKFSRLMSLLVYNNNVQPEDKKKCLPLILKWRDSRSISYYKTMMDS